eukprot:jgi/Botrbrau1/19800/Bobra.0124s0048.3
MLPCSVANVEYTGRMRSLKLTSPCRTGLPTSLKSVQGRQQRRCLRIHVSAMAAKPERRVVITGMGVVSPLGNDVGEFYNNLLEGKSGVSLIEKWDTEGYSTKFAGEIKTFDGEGYINPKNVRRLDDVIKYIILAGKKALEAAKLPIDKTVAEHVDPGRCGVLVGTAMGGMTAFAAGVEALVTVGHGRMSPFCIPFAITNMGGAQLAMDLGFMGPNYSISTACATGNYCLLNAADHIRRGDADIMLAGGADAAVIPSGIAGFIACKALSKRNDAPEKASRPWDRNRDGFVMGEGAGGPLSSCHKCALGLLHCEFWQADGPGCVDAGVTSRTDPKNRNHNQEESQGSRAQEGWITTIGNTRRMNHKIRNHKERITRVAVTRWKSEGI